MSEYMTLKEEGDKNGYGVTGWNGMPYSWLERES